MKAGVIAGWFREQSETRVLFATARSRVCFVRTFGYGYRAVARERVAYVAMIGRRIAGWFREQSETRGLLFRDRAIRGSASYPDG